MPILDRQRRLREIGRIRLGEQKVSSNGKKYPSSLDMFRLTSRSCEVLEQAAKYYGGVVSTWEGQHQLLTGQSALPVLCPPSSFAFSAWMEMWSAAGCLRRCDAQVCMTTDPESGERKSIACLCDPDAPECKPTTRLSVILRDLDGVGVWRCESHGNNAHDELEGSLAILSMAAGNGQIVPGTLRIEKRESKQPGQPTHNFVVPVLDLEIKLGDLFAASKNALEAGGGASPPASAIEPDRGIRLDIEPDRGIRLDPGGPFEDLFFQGPVLLSDATCMSIHATKNLRCTEEDGHSGPHRNGQIGWTMRQAK